MSARAAAADKCGQHKRVICEDAGQVPLARAGAETFTRPEIAASRRTRCGGDRDFHRQRNTAVKLGWNVGLCFHVLTFVIRDWEPSPRFGFRYVTELRRKTRRRDPQTCFQKSDGTRAGFEARTTPKAVVRPPHPKTPGGGWISWCGSSLLSCLNY